MAKQKKAQKPQNLGGGLMRRMRQGARKVAGQEKATKKPLGFWDILFWIAAGGAVLALLYRRFS